MASSQIDVLQERIFAQLTDPKLHPRVTRIDTHASSVFLENDRALKIKHAVRFPFLDYSTLEKRKASCDAEILINRSFAPQIYRRVAPITQKSDGSFDIDGAGLPVEYAVEMARFDESQTFDNLVKLGPLAPSVAESIAEVIAATHAIAPRAITAQWIETIAPIIDDNHAAFRNIAGFSVGELDGLREGSRSALLRHRQLLERRGHLGHVRRCHGDLHLGNIVLLAGKPVPFDAIEFDPSIASIDVLYDLAFPMMDFIRYGRGREANIVFNRYLQITSEDHLDALSTLALFLSLRAAVRAKVLLAQTRRKVGIDKAASEYFELACQLIQPPAPTLVAIGGLSGTGKSLLAYSLAPELLPYPGAVVLRTDVLRKQLLGVGEFDRLSEDAYRPDLSHQIYDILVERASRVLKQGHSVIVDGVFAKAEERSPIHHIARNLNVKFAGYFLQTSLAARIDRISHRSKDASDATPEIAKAQESYSIGTIDWATIDASGTPEKTFSNCKSATTNI